MLIEDTNKATRSQVKELTGLSNTHFQNLKKAGIFVAHERGEYDLKECIKNLCQYYADGHSDQTTGDERRQLIIAQRKQIELKMQTDKAELVPASTAQSAFAHAMVLIATQLDGLAGRVAGELAGIDEPAEIRSIVMAETRRIRETAADKLQDWASGK